MKRPPQVEWPPEWGTPSWSALSFSRSRWPGLALGALIAAAVAAGVCDSFVTWVVSFVIGVVSAATAMWGFPRPRVFWAAWNAGLFVLIFAMNWRKNGLPSVLFLAVAGVLTVVLGILLWLIDRRACQSQRLSARTWARASLRLSPDSLSWGRGPDQQIAWDAMTSVAPAAPGDPLLDSVTGDYRVIVRSERNVLVDLTETTYGPAATLFLLKHYMTHPEDRAELARASRFTSRAGRAARARFSYPKGQPAVTQPSPTHLPA